MRIVSTEPIMPITYALSHTQHVFLQLQELVKDMDCEYGGNESDGPCHAFMKHGPHQCINESIIRYAFYDKLNPPLDDQTVECQPFTEELCKKAFFSNTIGSSTLTRFYELMKALQSPTFAHISIDNSPFHTIIVVGLSEEHQLVGITSEVVWT